MKYTMRGKRRIVEKAAAAMLALLAAGCVGPRGEAPAARLPNRAPPRPPPQGRPARPPSQAVQPVQPRGFSLAGLENVMGRGARALEAEFGRPALDSSEGNGRKLQFAGTACVLDLYLYPPRGGGEPVVTYVDARLPDGRDVDRASCVAALAKARAP
jgi:hypothetical protein